MTPREVNNTFPLTPPSLLLGRKRTGDETTTISSAAVFLTGRVPSSAAGLSLIYHGNSCGIAQVIKGDPSNPELGPQAELDAQTTSHRQDGTSQVLWPALLDYLSLETKIIHLRPVALSLPPQQAATDTEQPALAAVM